MSNIFESIDVNKLRESAMEVLNFTGNKAKDVYGAASEKYDCLDDDVKKAITVGACVFGIVVLVAGCFYLLGKRAGRREKCEFEYEEWDG